MTPYDAVMVGMILAGMVWGLFRGVVWQVASIASLVLGYTASHFGSGQVAGYFPGDPLVARSLAMVSIYAGTSAGVFLVAWLIRATLRRMQFESYDRHLGMLLGGLEGALLVLVGTLFVVSLAPSTRDPIFRSPSGKVVATVMQTVGPVLPEEARTVLAPFLNGTSPGDVADPGAVPPPALASRPGPRRTTPAASGPAPSGSSKSLTELIQEGEDRLSKTIKDEAARTIQRATVGVGGGQDGTIERR